MESVLSNLTIFFDANACFLQFYHRRVIRNFIFLTKDFDYILCFIYSLTELRAQVETFGKSLVKFPPLIVDFTFKQHLAVHRKAQISCKKAFAAKIAVLETQKVCIAAISCVKLV